MTMTVSMKHRGPEKKLIRNRFSARLGPWVADKVTLYEYSTIQPCTYTADVTTFGTGAEGIRRKQETARFGEQQPQRRSLSAPEPHRDTVLM